MAWLLALGMGIFITSNSRANLVLTLTPANMTAEAGLGPVVDGSVVNTGADTIDDITVGSFNQYLYDAAGDSISFRELPPFDDLPNGETFGALMDTNVPASTPSGVYNSTEPSSYDQAYMYFAGADVTTHQTVDSNSVAYSVTVEGTTPVPEPATL